MATIQINESERWTILTALKEQKDFWEKHLESEAKDVAKWAKQEVENLTNLYEKVEDAE